MKRNLCKLLCLILALGMVIGCFAGCDSASGGRDRDDEEKTEKEDPRKDLEKYELNGLTYYLSEDFAEDTDYGDDYNSHSNGDGIDIEVTGGPMEDVTDDEIRTSKDFAQFFMDFIGDMYDESEMDSKNGTYYVVGISEGAANIMGFYVKDGYGWIIYIANEDGEATDELIDMVTLGQIDEDFDADEYLSASDEEDYEDYGDIEIEVNPSYDTFTVHAYAPDGWENPGCWAWSNTTGENVFNAWPGEPMEHVSGCHYTIEIPGWAEYIIVNGNEGTIQTQDEPVEPGCDIWVVISPADYSYSVYFYEPSAEELAEFGY